MSILNVGETFYTLANSGQAPELTFAEEFPTSFSPLPVHADVPDAEGLIAARLKAAAY